jgi:hypothetical protein
MHDWVTYILSKSENSDMHNRAIPVQSVIEYNDMHNWARHI